MRAATTTPVDPLRAAEDAIRSGERSARKGDVARRLGVCGRTVNRWIAAGLPCIRVGGKVYIGWQDLVAFMRRGRPELSPPKTDNSEAIEILRRAGYPVGG